MSLSRLCRGYTRATARATARFSTTITPRIYARYTTAATMDDKQHEHMLDLVRKMVPPLSGKLHKGQAGRIGVLGGSGDYSGAPFFAAMGAMRFGADLAHVICEPGAGAVIKTYSPDLIVHGILEPTLPLPKVKDELKGIMQRLHVLIVGPGLGRTEFMQSCAREALLLARDLDIGVVVDADGLWLLNSQPELVAGLEGRIILTPNVMEFRRLAGVVVGGGKAGGDAPPTDVTCATLARKLGSNIVIIEKGADDIISHGGRLPPIFGLDTDTLVDRTPGGLKRVGGQGDILSGTAGTLLAWGREWARGAYAHVGHPPDEQLTPHVALLAAYGASAFNRTVSARGFAKMGRSMVTHDLVDLVGPVYEDMFGERKGEGEKGRL